MNIQEKISNFINKNTNASLILELMTMKPYVTCADIINYNCANTEYVFTTCPHSIIRDIRKTFGYDFIKDEDIEFIQTRHTQTGREYKQRGKYKRYSINYEGV